jgi:hypothetical protein
MKQAGLSSPVLSPWYVRRQGECTGNRKFAGNARQGVPDGS